MTALAVRLALMLTIGFVLAVGLVRAQPYNDRGLGTFITPPADCPAPCFLGIQPGRTAIDDGLRLLADHAQVADLRQFSEGGRAYIDLRWGPDAGRAAVYRFQLLDRTIGAPMLMPDLSLGDLYLTLGPPAEVLLYRTRIYGETPLILVYPQQGLFIYVDLYLCSLRPASLWTMAYRGPRRESFYVGIGTPPRYSREIDYNYYRSFQYIEATRWLPRLRALNYCRGRG